MAKKKRGAPQKQCPACGAMIHARSKTCPECQTELEPKATAAPKKKRGRKRATKRKRTPAATGNLSQQLRSAGSLLDAVGGDVRQARAILEAVKEVRR